MIFSFDIQICDIIGFIVCSNLSVSISIWYSCINFGGYRYCSSEASSDEIFNKNRQFTKNFQKTLIFNQIRKLLKIFLKTQIFNQNRKFLSNFKKKLKSTTKSKIHENFQKTQIYNQNRKFLEIFQKI